MKYSLYYVTLITVYILPKAYSQGSLKGPGTSGCFYFGSTEFTCNVSVVAVEDLPSESTSLFYNDVYINASSQINIAVADPGFSDQINSLIKTGKPTFVYCGHTDPREWIDVLSRNNQDGGNTIKTEISNLKTYMGTYPNLTGIVLENLCITTTTVTMETSSKLRPKLVKDGFEYKILRKNMNDIRWKFSITTCVGKISTNLIQPPDVTNTAGLTNNFKAYLDELKSTFPDYAIGFDFYASTVITYYENSNPPEWLDFTVLDSNIDFYIFNVLSLPNECSDELKVGGTNVINGSAQYTIEKMVNYLVKAGIPKEKTYMLYLTGPTEPGNSVNWCYDTNQELCAKVSGHYFCADTTQTHYTKGAYAKQNAAGFIALYLDMIDDPFGACKCGQPYPGFYDILAGFNNAEVPAPCPLLDCP